MYNKSSRLVGFEDGPNKAPLCYVESDPSGRYWRLKEVLGKGAMKTVYRAFDEVLGMEVAWNQVTLCKVFQSPEELHRLYSEVHLLNNLHHPSIINFHASWIDVPGMTFNFITEMFTSGTLREYRNKYQRVDIRAVKNWGRQILRGLAYLHEHDPPVIHRDLKCDNIFVNGHLCQVKIGDLGLAAILQGSQYAHSVIGTPEFMAPELYEEEYDELVDIYSFGMCMLEMLTSDYPYSECSNPAQIYKKVTSGKLPEAFYRIEDNEAREFVGKCLETASKRLPARELLLDPFLATNQLEPLPVSKLPSFQKSTGEQQELAMASLLVDNSSRPTDVTITGTMNPEDDTIFLKVHIGDKDGHTRNIYFPFDINNDTAMDVAMEMVKELEITDLEPLEIADMIEEEITNLVPTGKQWRPTRFAFDDDNQCSFSYNVVEGKEDEMDDTNNHPFRSSSSRSSSHASLLGLPSSNLPRGSDAATCVHNWLQGDLFRNDDTSSQSSMNSFKYSALSGSEAEDSQPQPSLGQEEHAYLVQKLTRLGIDDRARGNSEQTRQRSLDPERKLSRIRSMVDVRSQLLHRSLVEQINKRRLFKTVGAAENIGYREPRLPHEKLSFI